MRRIQYILIFIMLAFIAGCAESAGNQSGTGETEKKDTTIQTTIAEITSIEPRKIVVENVVGMTLKKAREILEKAGFTNIIDDYDDSWDGNRLLVTKQSIDSGKESKPDDPIKLTCKRLCTISLNLTSSNNLVFSTYDMNCYVDDELLGTISNGQTFILQFDILEGEHVIKLTNAENESVKGTRDITVEGDMGFSCDLDHKKDGIFFENVEISEEVEVVEVKIPDVRKMVLRDAEKALEEAGFTDVRAEPYGKIWDEDNWLVTSQSIEPGMLINKSEHIQLDCTHLDDYFQALFSGKTLKEAQIIASEENLGLTYRSEDGWKDIGSDIDSLPEDNKQYWIVKDSSNYGAEKRTAKLLLSYLGTPEENIAKEESIRESQEQVSIQESIRESERQSSIEESVRESKRQESIKESKRAEQSASQNNGTESKTAETSPAETTEAQTSERGTWAAHSSGDRKIAAQGNNGVFAYVKTGKNYDIYIIIDFEDGFVYQFLDGDGNTYGDRVKIGEGDLNSNVIVTYHDGSSQWKEAFRFKWKNQPDILVYQDSDYEEYYFNNTDLDDALKIRDTKTIIDY